MRLIHYQDSRIGAQVKYIYLFHGHLQLSLTLQSIMLWYELAVQTQRR